MEPIHIHTSRLLLREFDLTDAPSFFELNADPEVLRWTGDVAFPDVATSEAFIRGYDTYRVHGFGRWTMVRLSDGEILGWCGLKRQPESFVDLGYRLHRRHWGQGYATEAAQASVDLGFQRFGLDAIIGRASRGNAASVRVLEKVGMRFWKDEACEGIEDSVLYRVERP